MNTVIMDKLQWAFDLLYGLYPRALRPHAAQPLLVGHRGVFEHPLILENTFAAFDLAISHGGGIEFDVHLTSDNVVIVHHDRSLLRVHGLAHKVSDLTLAQLQELAPAVPTFDELLARYGSHCPHYFLEPKVDDEASLEILLKAVGASLDRHDLSENLTVISSDPLALDATRQWLPAVAKAYIFMVDNRPAVAYARKHGDTGLAGWYFSFPEAMRPFLSERNLHQGVGQIDYPNTFRHFCNRGFTYHFTNRIDRIAQRPLDGAVMPLPTIGSEPGLVGATG